MTREDVKKAIMDEILESISVDLPFDMDAKFDLEDDFIKPLVMSELQIERQDEDRLYRAIKSEFNKLYKESVEDLKKAILR